MMSCASNLVSVQPRGMADVVVVVVVGAAVVVVVVVVVG
jgi:hypothetical protein